VLVVIDTLRADHLTPYGWPVPTSANLDVTLARRGVVVERAYSQAPWTVPSMVSMMAGRWPGEVMGRTIIQYGIPAGVPSLASTLQGLGYETAAFVGNPVLDPKVGFAAGFKQYYHPASGTATSTAVPSASSPSATATPRWEGADHLTRLAKQWLRARRADTPYFLYVHYVEPHDPYESPEVVSGRSPFFPDYRGEVNGTWPQGLLLGRIQLGDPASDLRHLRALYDSEIHTADRWLGALLNGFDAAAKARTLFVVTSDHGEELYDHGSWKHGRTMYEEQLRVPLVIRWDGQLPAGARVPGPVRLLDIAPTLVAAAGGTPPRAWQGEDLLPLLRGELRPRPRPPNYASHFLDGPRRPSALLGRWKLALFDRAARITPADAYASLLYKAEMARLPRIVLFDLSKDPRERHDLSAQHPDFVAGLGGIVQDHLGREVPGLRVLLTGVKAGVRVVAELRFRRPVRSWESCFLGSGDRVELDGDRLRLTLVGEALPKGVLLPEETEIVAVNVSTPAGVVVRLANGLPHRGGVVPAAGLRRDRWPAGGGARLLLWQPERPPQPAMESDPEAGKRLQSLGYAG